MMAASKSFLAHRGELSKRTANAKIGKDVFQLHEDRRTLVINGVPCQIKTDDEPEPRPKDRNFVSGRAVYAVDRAPGRSRASGDLGCYGVILPVSSMSRC
jgi:hypothetical protein